LSAVCQHGFKGERAGGLIDRAGQRLMIFDVDGTRETLLQRELPDVDGAPAPRRRQEATAPGYAGRKRADRVMTRMVVQQSHTQEFLGSLPMPGNGHRGPMMQWAARQIATYARSAAMPLQGCVTRSDGEHGIFTQVRPVVHEGLSFLTRCADYRFLDSATVKAALAAGTTVRMTHPDSGMMRDVFDVPSIAWPSSDDSTPRVRLVVTRSTFPADKKHRVGRRVGNDVFELFVTDRPVTSLHAADVVSVYLLRGQFEASLAQEERELPTGHWASNHPEGQRLWHLLAQWVWNLRLWLGDQLRETDAPLRRTDFTPRIETLPTLVTVDLDALQRAAAGADVQPASVEPNTLGALAPSTADTPPEPVQDASPTPPVEATSVAPPTPPTSPESKAASAPQALCFVRDAQGTMHCPAGHPMVLREHRERADGMRERHEVARQHCQGCPQLDACRGEGASLLKGRRIDVPVGASEVIASSPQSKPRVSVRVLTTSATTASAPAVSPMTVTTPPAVDTSLLWMDLAATVTRKALTRALDSLRVDVHVEVQSRAQVPELNAPLTRDRRAHRRRSRAEHLHRNRADEAIRWILRFHGLPTGLARHLGVEAIP
jgi:hypothetical protein